MEKQRLFGKKKKVHLFFLSYCVISDENRLYYSIVIFLILITDFNDQKEFTVEM